MIVGLMGGDDRDGTDLAGDGLEAAIPLPPRPRRHAGRVSAEDAAAFAAKADRRRGGRHQIALRRGLRAKAVVDVGHDDLADPATRPTPASAIGQRREKMHERHRVPAAAHRRHQAATGEAARTREVPPQDEGEGITARLKQGAGTRRHRWTATRRDLAQFGSFQQQIAGKNLTVSARRNRHG